MSQQRQQPSSEPQKGTSRVARRRRKRRAARQGEPKSPMLSEDLVRAPARERPETLTRPPDGTTLEQLIGELQSHWGVPESPQEFRITLKVAEEREGKGERTLEIAEDLQDPEEAAPDEAGKPRREKAPAAPRMGGQAGSPREPGAAPRKRRRGRRRRGGGGKGSSAS